MLARAAGAAAMILASLQSVAKEAPARLPVHALLLDIAGAGDRIVTAGQQGFLAWSADNGVSWTQAEAPADSLLTGLAFAGHRHGWAVGHGGIILRSEDAGSTWSRVPSPLGEDDSPLDVLALSPEHAFVVGAYGVFLETTDAGATWLSREPIEEDMHINRISRGPSGNLYLAGEAGMLARSTDGGATWEQLDAPYDGSFYGLLELSSGRLIAHGLRSHLLVSDDEGATWQSRELRPEALLMCGAETPSGILAVAGLGGVVFVSRNRGDTFVPAALATLKSCAELMPVGNSRLVAVGENGVEMVDVAPLSATR